ncbi:MAG: transpeptidase family protein [candidate division Zixibacteria bacterium]|nr:transpeptidase family protein [candidate division Zixibacteria bacterium]
MGTLVWLLILFRLFYFQVLKGAEYTKIALRQHRQHIKLEAKRGIIYDRNGKELVINLPVESFFAIPESVKNPDQVAKAFSLSRSSYTQIKKNLRTRKNFVWLKRKMEKEESQKIKQRKLEGVWALNETKRYHLYGDLAGEVLGFTDIDNKGLAGVEYQYDQHLKGKDGEGIFQRDGHRNSYQIAEHPLQKPEDGKSLVLTIDIELQSIVEEELKKGIELIQADGGSAIFMNPQTGEILTMAYCGKDDGLPVRNRTISDNFEPGSTFKIITAAAALEEVILSPQDSIFGEKGEFRIGKRIIHDVKSYEWLTFKESVMYSSNIALSKIAMMVGKEKLHQYACDFGMGKKTGIDLPGEAKGFIPSPKRWSDFVLSCVGFGQGISLTALQLVCAYGAIANDGILMKPFVVKAILDENKDTLKSKSPTQIRRVVSEETAHLLVDFMKGVVCFGTGQRAKMEGLSVGGKTGTAQKAKPGGGGYQKDCYITSFVGFFPAEDPQMVGLITLDSPRKEHLGGLTAAPVFKNATQRIVSLTGESLLTGTAKNTLSLVAAGMQIGFTEEKDYQQNWQSFDLFSEPDLILKEEALIPDVRGMTAREAVKIFAHKDLHFKLKGSGIVVKQIPEPNTRVNKNQECIIECQSE